MSLVIYIGHSGDTVTADASRISTLDSLKAYLEQNAGIAGHKQVLLTPKGKQVRAQTLLTENEIYAFDSSLLAPPSSTKEASSKEGKRALRLVPAPIPHEPGQPPDSINNTTDLRSWHELFTTRLHWATSLRQACATLATQAQKYAQEQIIIEKSLGVAVTSLKSHMRGAEDKYGASEGWCEDMLAHQERAIDQWEQDLHRLTGIPARQDFSRFVNAGHTVAQRKRDTTLQDFVNVQEVQEAGAKARDAIVSFARRVADLKSTLVATGKASDDLLSAVDQVRQSSLLTSSSPAMDSREEAAKLLEEVDIVVDKMRNDLDHVASLPPNGQGPSRASKMALLHTRNYLPSLAEFCGELNDLLRRTISSRNTAAETSMAHMQTLAAIEGRLSNMLQAIKGLEVSADEQNAFNLLNILGRLPHVYGSLLVEAVRRREWATKMTKDTATLAEEMATYQEEESRRRKKWLLSIDDVINLDVMTTKPQGVEMSLQADENGWPSVTRQELQDYLRTLEAVQCPPEVIQDLTAAIQDLDRPTKKQLRLARNAFKNGSVHDAAFGTTSLMLRGGDEQKVLRDVNAKLEEELRGQKSRVRKLEDLLHRQATLPRAVSNHSEMAGAAGSGFSPIMELMSNQIYGTPPMASSPFVPRTNDDAPKHASSGSIGAGSRRTSATLATLTEEKKLARRVVSLEAELQQVKERSVIIEKEKKALEEAKTAFDLERQQQQQEEGTKQAQFDEAVSTKKDIMQNMEAQQREFADERRVLEEELRSARARVEEIEDEMERVLGSRDHVDTRTKELEIELEQFRQQAEENEKTRLNQIEDLKKEVAQYREQSLSWEGKLEQARREAQESESVIEDLRRSRLEGLESLTSAHKHLSPQTHAPENYTDLVTALEGLAERASTHAKELFDSHELLVSEKQSLQAQHDAKQQELGAASAKYAVLEAEVIRLRDEMVSEKAHAASLSSCLDDERTQLRDLRSTIASGETGADVLRKRVEEEEGKVMDLTNKLAEVASNREQMEEELARAQSKLAQAESDVSLANQRLDLRASRANQISQRLYAQNTRFLRLLDQLGFMVSHNKDGTMIIERASKVNNAASTTFDLAAPHAQTPPSPITSKKASHANPNELTDPATLSFLHWSDAPDAATEETAYAYFTQQTSLFDPQIFSDALSKRLRDFEYTARKWSKEAKSFSTLAARLRQESNQKIAVRDFKEGDLALFLPTRGELGNKGAWAAFNIGAPHHFLRERESMGLGRREYIVARISRVEERVVDLKAGGATAPPVKGSGDSFRSAGSTSVDAASLDERRERDDENPFELSDGLTWYLVHAAEDKAGAPSTPGLGKVTVASSSVDAKGSIRLSGGGRGRGGREGGGALAQGEAVKTLGNVKSADSRRSSEASRKGGAGVGVGFLGREARRVPSDQSSVHGLGISASTSPPTTTNVARDQTGGSTVAVAAPAAAAADNDQVRRDLLFGP